MRLERQVGIKMRWWPQFLDEAWSELRANDKPVTLVLSTCYSVFNHSALYELVARIGKMWNDKWGKEWPPSVYSINISRAPFCSSYWGGTRLSVFTDLLGWRVCTHVSVSNGSAVCGEYTGERQSPLGHIRETSHPSFCRLSDLLHFGFFRKEWLVKDD